MRGVSRFDFLVNSAEFRIFARPSGSNIEKALGSLSKMTASETYERLKQATGVNEADYDMLARDMFAVKLADFNFYLKKVKPFLKDMKMDLAV